MPDHRDQPFLSPAPHQVDEALAGRAQRIIFLCIFDVIGRTSSADILRMKANFLEISCPERLKNPPCRVRGSAGPIRIACIDAVYSWQRRFTDVGVDAVGDIGFSIR